VNCKGSHPSYSRTCPSWIREKEIQIIKTEKNISYPEARKLIISRTPKPDVSYAAATISKSVRDVGVQTNFTDTKNSKTIATEKETNDKHKSNPRKKNKNTTDTHNVNPQLFPNQEKIQNTNRNPENTPLPKKAKKVCPNTNTHKQLTAKDFLKNRPITQEPGDQTDDPLKVYISPEEDMLTDSMSGSDADAPDPDPDCF
jgi:hypothetical protein